MAVKRTPLYEAHLRLGGTMIDFGGWELPVQYTGVISEHEHVRNAAGLFDVSHMGEIWVKGADAESFLQKMLTNDLSKAQDLQAVYSPMCHEDGGTVDDLLVYKYSQEDYLLVVNASNTSKDYQWLKNHATGQVVIENVSDQYAQLALQGPKAESILQAICDAPLGEIGFFRFWPSLDVGGVTAMVSRTGYTGEDGFELYVSPDEAPRLWNIILDAGADHGLVAVGLGARDTLRLEAALPLYGQELSELISPLEAGLGMFVKTEKDGFIGKDALIAQKQNGLKRKRIGFEMTGAGIPRHSFDVLAGGRVIGFVTSGSFSPRLKKSIGLAIIESGYAAEGTELDISIRNKTVKARVIKLPFYSKKYKTS